MHDFEDYKIPDGATPDDVFETPLFKMERFGRVVRMVGHRTEEQQREFVEKAVRNRPRLVARADEIRSELQKLIRSYSSLELLAQLISMDLFCDPETYREFDSKMRPHFVEYLALLELSEPAYEIRNLNPPGEDVERAHKLMEELFQLTFWFYATEHFEEPSNSAPSTIQELRVKSLFHSLLVRSPAYHDHWVEVLRELFGTPPVVAWLREQKLEVNEVLKCVEACGNLPGKRLVERILLAKQEGRELNRRLKEFRRAPNVGGGEGEFLRMLSSQRGEKRTKAMENMLGAWAFFALAETWSFSAADVAAEAGVEEETAESFLSQFSLGFGQPTWDSPWPRPTHDLQLRPIIQHGQKFMFAAPHLLLWAVKPSLEAKLQGECRTAWEAYERARSKFLVSEALRLLGDVFGRCMSHQALYYEVSGKRCELDGLLVYDRYVFLIEAKAGAVSAATRRGGPKRIVADLRELVKDPAEQALRAKEFIISNADPIFYLDDGSEVIIDRARCTELVSMSVTLDDLGIFTSDPRRLPHLGLAPAGELPLAIFLLDLRIVAEVLLRPSEFLHYLRWRSTVLSAQGIFGTGDEMDWLGVYLKEGSNLLTRPQDLPTLSFTSHTKEFDDYYLYKMGQRSNPAPKPAQYIPRQISRLIDQLERTGSQGFTRATEALLELTNRERTTFGKLLQRHVRPGSKETTLEGKRLLVVLTFGKNSCACAEEAASVGARLRKPVLVLSVERGTGKVSGWGVAT